MHLLRDFQTWRLDLIKDLSLWRRGAMKYLLLLSDILLVLMILKYVRGVLLPWYQASPQTKGQWLVITWYRIFSTIRSSRDRRYKDQWQLQWDSTVKRCQHNFIEKFTIFGEGTQLLRFLPASTQNCYLTTRSEKANSIWAWGSRGCL